MLAQYLTQFIIFKDIIIKRHKSSFYRKRKLSQKRLQDNMQRSQSQKGLKISKNTVISKSLQKYPKVTENSGKRHNSVVGVSDQHYTKKSGCKPKLTKSLKCEYCEYTVTYQEDAYTIHHCPDRATKQRTRSSKAMAMHKLR